MIFFPTYRGNDVEMSAEKNFWPIDLVGSNDERGDTLLFVPADLETSYAFYVVDDEFEGAHDILWTIACAGNQHEIPGQ